MSISTERILDAFLEALEAAGTYDGLSGQALDDAKAATRDGAEPLITAIVDELVANAEVVNATVDGNAEVVGGEAITDGLPIEGGGLS